MFSASFHYPSISLSKARLAYRALLALLLLSLTQAMAGTQTFSSPGTTSWTMPAGVTVVTVQAWAGGGAGGGATGGKVTGGGGGGGAFVQATVIVTPGVPYNVVVGAGGAGVSGNSGGNGGNSTFNGTSVVAPGGSGGGAGTIVSKNPVYGSAGTGGTGTYNGGNGAPGTSGASGAGGGGAGSGGNGGNATTGTAGSGGSGGGGGGSGGTGQTSNTNGIAGTPLGGGGSGANTNSSSYRGGAGAAGQVVLTWNVAPTVTAISPNSGPAVGGTSVTITGIDFISGATVKIGGTLATGVTWVSATSITATTPAGTAGAKDVVVTNPDTQTGTLSGGFTYVAAPTVTAISPTSGPAVGGSPVTITGTGFSSGATVKIGGTLATSVTWVSATSITATTPLGTAGAKDVVVTNPDTQTGTRSGGFTYVAAPTVTAISPTSGPAVGGTPVTITGTGFSSGATVKIGGTLATGVTWINATSITATTPAGTAGAKDVVVTNPDTQTGTLTNGFVYSGAFTVTGISPSSGPVAGGTPVTITGTGFDIIAASASVGGSTCTVTGTTTTTTLTCTTTTHAAGTVNVVVTNPGPQTGTLSGGFTYVAAPTVTAISPPSGPTAGGTAVTITGTDFTGATAYTIRGVSLTGVTVVNATTITGTTPPGIAGTASVLVTTPYGTNVANTLFTYVTPPTATTNAASGVTAYDAMLNGTVSSNADVTTVYFDFGLDTTYGGLTGITGATITATPSPLNGNVVGAAVSADLSGLNCNTQFHYRVVATNNGGATYGLDSTFTTGACSAPFPATACAATRFDSDLNCTANDVSLTSITLAPTTTRPSCVSGTPVTLDLDLTVNFASPNRYDIGIFIANDGKLPTLLSAHGGSGSCSVGVLPITSQPFPYYQFPDLDGGPKGTLDTCGDGNSSINGGTGSGIKHMAGVSLPCYASPDSGGKLFVPFAVSWDNQASPIGSLCTSNLYPVPNTTSKCNAPASSVSINVVVLPVITITDGISQINPGANVTYTVVITNNSGGKLLDMVFTNPALGNLTVNSVTCAASGTSVATCPPISSTTSLVTGIYIPSADLPSTQTTFSSLTFTINATLASTATVGSHLINTATVTTGGGNPASATDDDLIQIAPSVAKSFTPSTITEGASSTLTVTLTNPTASPVTGVAFTDNYPSGLINTAAAGGATTCGGTFTAVNGGSLLALSGGTIPANGNCTVTVNVTVPVIGTGSYTNTVTTSGGLVSTVSATLTVTAAVFGAFNACDVAAAPDANCTNTTTATNSRITTKIAGSTLSLDLVALKSDGTRNTGYNSNVKVELLDASNNSGALDSKNCRSTWTTTIATLSSNPAFSGANGLITVGPFTFTNVAQAYRDVRVRVTNVGGTTALGCSTDDFAIRPDHLLVTPTDDDRETAGTTRPLTNTAMSGAVVHKAGRPFTVTATAVNTSGGTTTNYNVAVIPTATPSNCSGGTACSTASVGSFTLGATTSFVSGVLSSTLATYSEVGAFNLTLQDSDFASVDAADTAASCAGRYVCGTASVGRFVPDHFNTYVVSRDSLPMLCPTGLTCPPSYNGFVYSSQPFTVRIDAQNAADVTTRNYDTGLGLSKAVTLAAYNAVGETTLNPRAGTLNDFSVASTAFALGSATVPNQPSYALPTPYPSTTPTAPTNIYIRAMDDDAVTSLRASSIEGGVMVVSGRIWVSNAYGSELLQLSVPLTLQYWNGSGWVTSTTDGVTSFPNDKAAFSNCHGSLSCPLSVASPSPMTFTKGAGSYVLAAPGLSGNASMSVGSLTYLPSTTGLATFGTYKSRFIFLRENY